MKIFKTLAVILIVAFVSIAVARTAPPTENAGSKSVSDSKAIRPIQENRVHRAGLFWMNVTNNGYFGNPDSMRDPCTGKIAVSGELPGGTGTDFLFVGSLLFGGYLNSDTITVDTDQAHVFDGPLVTTSYEGWTGENGTDDMARECWPVMFDEDESGAILGQINESSNVEGRISCLFEEVYDPFATAAEQFNLMYTDKFVMRSP